MYVHYTVLALYVLDYAHMRALSESRDFPARVRRARANNSGAVPIGQTLRIIMAYQKRLKKEYEEMSKRAPTGISLDPSTMEDNIDM